MNKESIEKIVDTAFDSCFADIQPLIKRELYPAAFANPHSWLKVTAAIDLQNLAIRKAVKQILSETLSDNA